MSSESNKIVRALTALKAECQPGSVDINDLRMVIFSDQHKGKNDGADDFKNCKAAYHAALGYYLSSGFTLCLLGDVEELWECQPGDVVKTYNDTFELEHKFVQAGRYLRIIGNHDDLWQIPGKVTKHLQKYLVDAGDCVQLHRGVVLTIHARKEKLGELFLVHGHQGTGSADQFSWLSRIIVRYVWRNFQRLTRMRIDSSPAERFDLRSRHEMTLFDWASAQSRLILIAGHTHHPVFSSESHESYINSEVEKLNKQMTIEQEPSQRKKIQQEIHYKQAELHWVLAKSNSQVFEVASDAKPCYFNTGCCCFKDGDITGIEIENGEIRLVRWPDDQGSPRQKVLRKGNLQDLLDRCR